MNCPQSFISNIAVCFMLSSGVFASRGIAQAKVEPSHLVRFMLINMSGKSREAHLHGGIVALPVGQAVALQAPPGDSIKVTSRTDQHFVRVVTISRADEGRFIPVD